MKQILIISSFLMLGILSLWSQNGLKADYYDGKDFNKYVATNYVDKIDFYWLTTPPVPGINPRLCSIRYTGRVKSPGTGVVTFSARVDDGIRVWVNEELIIDNWKLNDVGYSNGQVEMEADKFYDIKIEYFNALLEGEIRLLWELPEKETKKTEEKSWFASWWEQDEEKAVVISSKYFAPPVEEVIVEAPTLEPPPVVQPKPKPQPKPKLVSKAKPIKKKPVVLPPNKEVVETIQQYLPKNVAFNQAESVILSVSYPELDKLADYLEQHPTHKVRIEGHTDNVGNEEKNLKLSERRAYAVAAYLVKKGVSPKQLSAKGFGGTKPLVKSEGKQYHPENRRVAFIIE